MDPVWPSTSPIGQMNSDAHRYPNTHPAMAPGHSLDHPVANALDLENNYCPEGTVAQAISPSNYSHNLTPPPQSILDSYQPRMDSFIEDNRQKDAAGSADWYRPATEPSVFVQPLAAGTYPEHQGPPTHDAVPPTVYEYTDVGNYPSPDPQVSRLPINAFRAPAREFPAEYTEEAVPRADPNAAGNEREGRFAPPTAERDTAGRGLYDASPPFHFTSHECQPRIDCVVDYNGYTKDALHNTLVRSGMSAAVGVYRGYQTAATDAMQPAGAWQHNAVPASTYVLPSDELQLFAADEWYAPAAGQVVAPYTIERRYAAGASSNYVVPRTDPKAVEAMIATLTAECDKARRDVRAALDLVQSYHTDATEALRRLAECEAVLRRTLYKNDYLLVKFSNGD
ncbi:hypothetical protein BV25DRAFT_1912709 [Artomyces pyxidatus]|uniref:Uncharacterized protein n=1 Tax=Artomyces pyxidatus TaxID=48021 RepID=A0ACB8TE05_9AGAM|nr:hypothetical protein BV25DRAFT_1912709 [Artomyces pyxidatus]